MDTIRDRKPDPALSAEIQELCDQIAKAEPQDTQTLFGDLHKMAELYYQGALQQATHSFRAAQIAAAVGTAFFLAAVIGITFYSVHRSAWISLIAGATIQVVSGLNFYMYGKATKQFGLFHVCLERMGRYLMANSVCANIQDPEKRDQARLELASIMAHAPMLPVEGFDERPRRIKSPRVVNTRVAAQAVTAWTSSQAHDRD